MEDLGQEKKRYGGYLARAAERLKIGLAVEMELGATHTIGLILNLITVENSVLHTCSLSSGDGTLKIRRHRRDRSSCSECVLVSCIISNSDGDGVWLIIISMSQKETPFLVVWLTEYALELIVS